MIEEEARKVRLTQARPCAKKLSLRRVPARDGEGMSKKTRLEILRRGFPPTLGREKEANVGEVWKVSKFCDSCGSFPFCRWLFSQPRKQGDSAHCNGAPDRMEYGYANFLQLHGR